MLTADKLKSLLSYEPSTGVFTRLKNAGGKLAGSIAGSKNPGGYIDISVAGKTYRAHRLAFLYMTGYFPACDVDHINRNKTGNRWNNLREVSKTLNNRNTNAKGYSFDKATGKYRAQIMVDFKNISLGRFATAQEAEQAYAKAKAEYHTI